MARRRPINAGVPRGAGRAQQKPRPPRRDEGKPRNRGGQQRGGRGAERDYLKPATEGQLRKETRAATNTKFRPLERAIGADVRASKQRGREVGTWFDNYLAQVNAGAADTAAAYAQAGQEMQGQIAQASLLDSANTQRLNQEGAESAALRGAPMDYSGAEREAAAQAQRNYLATAGAGALSREGAIQRGYLNEQKRIGAGQRIASGKEEQRRERSLRKDRRDVRRERGEYATAKRGELTERERDYLIQRKAFGLEKKEGQREAREAAADRAYERRQDRIGNRQAQERIGISRRNAQDEKQGGRTPAEKQDAREGRQNAVATARRLIQAHGAPKTAKEWADLEEAIAKESEVSPAEARYAVSRLKPRITSRQKKQRQREEAARNKVEGTVIQDVPTG